MVKERDMETGGGIPEAADLLQEPESKEAEEANGNVADLSLESLQVQVDKNRTDIVHLMTRTGTPRPRTQAEVDELVKTANAEDALSAEQKTERTIRKYVKRTGGYRKGITPAEKALAGRLLKKLGRSTRETVDEDTDQVVSPAWDTDLLL